MVPCPNPVRRIWKGHPIQSEGCEAIPSFGSTALLCDLSPISALSAVKDFSFSCEAARSFAGFQKAGIPILDTRDLANVSGLARLLPTLFPEYHMQSMLRRNMVDTAIAKRRHIETGK